ncbi:MAG: RHS repeat domain-containing protein, partial [Acidimicrobiales bacterium]
MKPSRGQHDAEHRSNAQLTSIEDFFGAVTSFGYGARGSLTSITYPSATGSSITYAYDQAL